MHIETQQYSDPNQMTFLPHCMLLESGAVVFENQEQATPLPLARALFDVDGVSHVKIGTDFIQISKREESDWQHMQTECCQVIEAQLTPLLAKVDGKIDSSTELLMAEAAIFTGYLLS